MLAEDADRCNACLGEAPKSAHGVPTRPWLLNRLRDVEADAEGLRTPQIHCDAFTILLGVFMQRQAIPMVYDAPKRTEGFGAWPAHFPHADSVGSEGPMRYNYPRGGAETRPHDL